VDDGKKGFWLKKILLQGVMTDTEWGKRKMEKRKFSLYGWEGVYSKGFMDT